MTEKLSFAEEINANKNTAEVSTQSATLETSDSSLNVRLRGAYITNAELTSQTTGERIAVLYADDETTKPKITATHAMLPAGPYDGIGGQHGFPRWADYHEFAVDDGPSGEKRLALQAKRSDEGLSLVKAFELTESSLTSRTTVISSEDKTERTSIGEHLYFSLANETLDGLSINGKTIDELLGSGSEATLKSAGTLSWDFDGEAIITFPAGHSVKISASFEGDTTYPPAMWIWKRPDSPSICFEPVVGVQAEDRSGVNIAPYAQASLTSKIELL